MKLENTSKTMTVNHLEDGLPSMTTQLILLILIAIAFVGSIWYLLPMRFMVNGAQTVHFIELPPQICLPSDARERLQLITERQTDYLQCLKMVMKQ